MDRELKEHTHCQNVTWRLYFAQRDATSIAWLYMILLNRWVANSDKL